MNWAPMGHSIRHKIVQQLLPHNIQQISMSIAALKVQKNRDLGFKKQK
jgi:hypothetical protein